MTTAEVNVSEALETAEAPVMDADYLMVRALDLYEVVKKPPKLTGAQGPLSVSVYDSGLLTNDGVSDEDLISCRNGAVQDLVVEATAWVENGLDIVKELLQFPAGVNIRLNGQDCNGTAIVRGLINGGTNRIKSGIADAHKSRRGR